MNRRKFLSGFAALPVAAVAVSVGVQAAPAIKTGFYSKVRWPRLYQIDQPHGASKIRVMFPEILIS